MAGATGGPDFDRPAPADPWQHLEGPVRANIHQAQTRLTTVINETDPQFVTNISFQRSTMTSKCTNRTDDPTFGIIAQLSFLPPGTPEGNGCSFFILHCGVLDISAVGFHISDSPFLFPRRKEFKAGLSEVLLNFTVIVPQRGWKCFRTYLHKILN